MIVQCRALLEHVHQQVHFNDGLTWAIPSAMAWAAAVEFPADSAWARASAKAEAVTEGACQVAIRQINDRIPIKQGFRIMCYVLCKGLSYICIR